MKQCTRCKREFPDHLINAMAIGEPGKPLRYEHVCPICGLEIMNEHHSVKRNGFIPGSIAQKMLMEARMLVTKEKG